MKPTIGVALGGGAARGLAHLGVLEVLSNAGITPDVVVGTSFGALVGGAVLANDGDADRVIDQVVAYVHGEEFRRSQLNFFRRKKSIEQTGLLLNLRDLIKRGIYYGFARTRGSFIAADEFRDSIHAIVPDRRIETLGARFAAVTADITSGEELLLDRGSLRVAVRASCAIPGVMPPVTVAHGRTCIDGGWVNKVPAEPALALGADFVIAVDVSDDLADTVDLTTGLNVVMRGDAIQSHRLKTVQLTRADHVIRCPLAHVDWADFPRAEEIIGVGRLAAEDALPELESQLSRARSLPSSLRRAFEEASRGLGLLRRRRPMATCIEAMEVGPIATEEAEPPDGTEEPIPTASAGDPPPSD